MAKAQNEADARAAERTSFFRDSGWLMIANVVGGVFMWAVHLLTKKIPQDQYGVFGALLTVVLLVPTIPLQMVIAQQAAKALAMDRRAELSAILRWFTKVTFVLWLLFAVAVIAGQGWILHRWQLPSAIGLWLLLPIVLLATWLPLFWGALQGQQNFLWLGASMIANGVGRLAVAALAVFLLHLYSTGMMAGVLMGYLVANVIAIWHAGALWRTSPAPFDSRALARQVLPLMLAFFGFQVLFTADTLFVKAYFPTQTGFYLSAGTLSRALMWLVGPLASVMFPRLVQGAAKAEKFDLMGLVLVGTAILAVTGATGLALLGPWVVKLVYTQEYVAVSSAILPWYAGAMVPLAIANVLLNDLLARPSSKGLLACCVFGLAIAYGFALTVFHSSPVAVLQTLGVFNLLLLAICAGFSWKAKHESRAEPVE